MSKPKSENEIKMTFGEAIAITQQTYNYFKLIKKEKRRDRKNFSNTLNLRLKKYIKLNQCIDKTKKEHYEKNFQECNQCIINKFEDFNQSVIEKIKELKITNQDTHAKFVELKKIIDQSTSGKFEELKTTIYQDIKSFDEVEKQINQLQERKIKIENDIQQTENDDIRNLNNEEIGNFKLYSITYDEKSNFSGITYINEREDAIDVAIACRGTAERIDWIQNLAMPFFRNTCSDRTAQAYATKILAKIRKQHQNKQINVITLGHSKGGREAQKQMLALLSKYKDDNKVNVCCLTFNSAPIVFYEFYQIGKHKDYCQNLYLTDELKIFKDILKLFNYFKYGNNCAYPLKGKFVGIIIFLSLLLVGPALYTIYPTLESEMPLLAFPTTLGIIIIILFFVLSFTKSLFIIVTCVLVLTFLLDSLQPLICINLVITAILVMVLSHYTHGINIFKDEKSSYEKLKDKNIREIICAKDLDKLANLKFRYISKSTQKLINGVPKFPYASRIYPKH